MEFRIETDWNGEKIKHSPVVIRLEKTSSGIQLTVTAPFFNDPPPTRSPPGQPCAKLWEHEVVEAFFMNNKEQYLEVEFSPHGQHLVLQLEGCRNMLRDELPLVYKAEIDHSKQTWTGVAEIPFTYFPHDVTKLNCYAIHEAQAGEGFQGRVYEALYPTPTGKYSEPDYHRLDYFREICFPDNFIEDKHSGQWGKTPV